MLELTGRQRALQLPRLLQEIVDGLAAGGPWPAKSLGAGPGSGCGLRTNIEIYGLLGHSVWI